MTTSHEKILATLDSADRLADDPEQTTVIRTAAAALMMFRSQLLAFLPESRDELDTLLAQGARWLIELRSDDAAAIELAPATPSTPDAVQLNP